MKAVLIGLSALMLAVIFRHALAGLGRLALRSGAWLGMLWLLRQAPAALGITLGVNLFNAVTLGVLGAPGLALLLMIRWLFR